MNRIINYFFYFFKSSKIRNVMIKFLFSNSCFVTKMSVILDAMLSFYYELINS